MIAELTNHLWQSTLFAVAVAILVLALRRNRAAVRYWLWFSASLKFFVPFALLMTLGSRLEWAPAAKQMAPPAISFTVLQLAQPFPEEPLPYAPPTPPTPARRDWFPIALAAVWACGFAAVALIRFRGWLRIRTAVGRSTPIDLPARGEVRSSPGLLEPGVVGLWRPVLLLPAGIADRLTPPQLDAVLAHELCHVRRRDNLFAAIHMVVEAIFWFHPLVWRIGARLVEERERACDEEVLSLGSEPLVYAEAILNVCKLYVESPLICMSGVTGSDLKKRIEGIMTHRIGLGLSFGKKLLLAAAAILAASAPLMVGLAKAQSEAALSFEVASVKPHPIRVGFIRRPQSSTLQCPPWHCGISGNRFTEEAASLTDLMMDAYSVKRFQISGLPDWGDSGRDVYDIVAKVEGNRTPTPAEARRMLQTLLADRFQLKLHHETRMLPVYALVIGKNGPKLFPAPQEEGKPPAAVPAPRGGGSDGGGRRGGGGALAGEAAAFFRSWELVPELLSTWADRPVIDKTGFQGSYRTRDGKDPLEALDVRQLFQDRSADPDASSGASIFSQVQEKWGLKLEPQKGPVDVLVIDRVERPSSN